MKRYLKILASLGLALILSAPALASAQGATVAELFLMLPSSECGGYNVAQRQDMLAKVLEAPGGMGPASVPDSLSPWVRLPSENYLVLQRPWAGPITYKLFEGRAFQLLVICRGRNRPAPGDPVGLFDLSLYRLDRQGLNWANIHDYLPGIGILDFVTADTVIDPQAVRDLARLAPTYTECLSCSLSATNRLTMDIVTATSLNAAPCENLLPTFGRLPLTWDGLIFIKPYDRAAPREDERDRRRRLNAEETPNPLGQ